MLCPCDLKKNYSDCCGRYHQGVNPETALSLMRSRYSAYALHLAIYIMKTTHPNNPKFQKNRRKWAQEILEFCQTTAFQELEILSFTEEETIAYVTFIAHLEQNNKPYHLKEKSRFEKINGIWLYREVVDETL